MLGQKMGGRLKRSGLGVAGCDIYVPLTKFTYLLLGVPYLPAIDYTR